MESSAFQIDATAEPVAEMDRLGDEIAELSAHLDAATAHLLELIREFDARGGWSQRLPLLRPLAGLARRDESRRRSRACPRGARPRLAAPPGRRARPRGAVVLQGAGADPRGHARDRGAAARGRQGRHRLPRRAHRPRLAPGRPARRGPRDRAASQEPRRCTCTRTKTAWS